MLCWRRSQVPVHDALMTPFQSLEGSGVTVHRNAMEGAGKWSVVLGKTIEKQDFTDTIGDVLGRVTWLTQPARQRDSDERSDL